MEWIQGVLGDTLLLVCVVCFLKVLTTLSILRLGLGWEGSGFGLVILGLSLAITVLVMEPSLQSVSKGGAEVSAETKKETEAMVTAFMLKNTDEALLARVRAISSTGEAPATTHSEEVKSSRVLAAAFLLSQLSQACILGFLILLPFVLIDLVVVHLSTILGLTSFQPQMVSVPAKLLLLISAEAWLRLTEKFVGSFSGMGA